jgi:hypothetical protein
MYRNAQALSCNHQSLVGKQLTNYVKAVSLWIIAALQYPYSGDVSVSAEPFERVLMSFKKRQDRDKSCHTESPVALEELSCGKLSLE